MAVMTASTKVAIAPQAVGDGDQHGRVRRIERGCLTGNGSASRRAIISSVTWQAA